MRRLPGLLAIAALAAAALTGCASAPSGTGCGVKPGPASDTITATGAFDAASLKVSMPSPVVADTTERTTLIQGKGEPLRNGQVAKIVFHIYDGATGQLLGDIPSSYYSNTYFQQRGLIQGLGCVPEGSRVAIVVPPKDGAGEIAQTDGSVVLVGDFSDYLYARATGTPQLGKSGFPQIVRGKNGQPGVVIPESAAEPKRLQSEVTILGSGKKLTKDDSVIVQQTTVDWKNRTVTDTTWNLMKPTQLTLSDGSPVSKQLIGKKVGSQVVILLPSSVNNGTSAVEVVDLLGTLPTAQQ